MPRGRYGLRPPRRTDKYSRYQAEWMADAQESVEITPQKIGFYFFMILLITQIATYFNFYSASFERRYPRQDTFLSHWSDMFTGGPIYVALAALAFYLFSCKLGFETDVAMMLGVIFFLDDGLIQFLLNNASACFHIICILSMIYCGLQLQEEVNSTFSKKWNLFLILTIASGTTAISLYPESIPLMFIVLLFINIAIQRSSIDEKFGVSFFSYLMWLIFMPIFVFFFIPCRFPLFDFSIENFVDEFKLCQWNEGTLIPAILAIPLIAVMRTKRTAAYLMVCLIVSFAGLFVNFSHSLSTMYMRLFDFRIIATAVAAIVLGRQKFMFTSFVVILISFAAAWIRREQFLPIDIDFL